MQSHNGRRCFIGLIQDLSAGSELMELPKSYCIGSDHQHDNCQKTRSQTYAYRQVSLTKQIRDYAARVSHGSKTHGVHAKNGDSPGYDPRIPLTSRKGMLLIKRCVRTARRSLQYLR